MTLVPVKLSHQTKVIQSLGVIIIEVIIKIMIMIITASSSVIVVQEPFIYYTIMMQFK